LSLPLEVDGTVSYLETRLPTPEEINLLHRVKLSSDIVPWDPKADYFKDQEQACIDRRLRVPMCSTLQQPYSTHRYPLPRVSSIFAFYRNPEAYIDDSGCDLTELRSSEYLAQRLISSVQIQPDDKEGNGLLTRSISAMHFGAPDSVITKEILVTRWCIGLESASRTLNVTTQNGIRKVVLSVERRFRTKQSHLRFPTLDGKWFSNTTFPVQKSICGNSFAQLTTNGKGYTHFFPMRAKSETPDALMDFIHENGVPAWLVVDNAPKQNHAWWNKIQREFHIRQTNMKPYSLWQNRAEGEIRELKKMIKRLTLRCNSPKRLWCFAGELAAAIRRLTATDHALLRG
jgi:hypothetical protein